MTRKYQEVLAFIKEKHVDNYGKTGYFKWIRVVLLSICIISLSVVFFYDSLPNPLKICFCFVTMISVASIFYCQKSKKRKLSEGKESDDNFFGRVKSELKSRGFHPKHYKKMEDEILLCNYEEDKYTRNLSNMVKVVLSIALSIISFLFGACLKDIKFSSDFLLKALYFLIPITLVSILLIMLIYIVYLEFLCSTRKDRELVLSYLYDMGYCSSKKSEEVSDEKSNPLAVTISSESDGVRNLDQISKTPETSIDVADLSEISE